MTDYFHLKRKYVLGNLYLCSVFCQFFPLTLWFFCASGGFWPSLEVCLLTPLLGVAEWMLLAPNEKPAALLTILQCAQQAPAAQAPWPQLSAVLRLRVCSVSSQMLNRTQEVTQEIVQRAFRSPTALLWQLSRWSSGNAAGLLQTVLLLN